ncbi:MAG: hypothetical protein JST94_01135 [Bacteroidetes bacterium]|jgi:hypothetical protein|nr:hypothetical protein [Bacteroidota bacterium]MBS1670058.1 hypothetical protein [Bacteroidota bacterium]
MKQFLILTILTIALTNLKAQTLKNKSKEFIIDFYKQKSNSTIPFLFTKGINQYEKKELAKAFERNDTLKKWSRIDNKLVVIDSLILTKNEKQYIIDELGRQTDTSLWNEINIPNSLTISQDTITAIFKDRTRGWNYFYKTYGRSFNSFTIPIFFRNNELCAFYYDNSCGRLCGEGVFAIYKRENGNWIMWFRIYEWVS